MSVVPELKSANQIAAELKGEADPETEQSTDPKAGKVYTFSLSHTDPQGKLWTGKFTNRILTIGQRRAQRIMKAQLANGVPVAALDSDTWEMNEIISHLAISLDRAAAGFPDWAKDLESLYDEALVYALYAEVASHEATFRGRAEATRPSAEADTDGAG